MELTNGWDLVEYYDFMILFCLILIVDGSLLCLMSFIL